MTRSLVTLALIATISMTAACKKQVEPVAMDEPTATVAPTLVVPERFNEAVATMRENFQRVHFAFDSATLDETSKQALAHNARIMQKHSSVQIEVQGHADERGTTDYNLALGQRRAESVRTYMLSHGVSTKRIRTVSYGEEIPLASGSGETAWSQNRRAEFRILYNGSPEVVGTIQ